MNKFNCSRYNKWEYVVPNVIDNKSCEKSQQKHQKIARFQSVDVEYPLNTLQGLPDELKMKIFDKLGLKERSILMRVCKQFYNVLDSEISLEYFNERKDDIFCRLSVKLNNMISCLNGLGNGFVNYSEFNSASKPVLLISYRQEISKLAQVKVDEYEKRFSINLMALLNLWSHLNGSSVVFTKIVTRSTAGAQLVRYPGRSPQYVTYDVSMANELKKMIKFIINFMSNEFLINQDEVGGIICSELFKFVLSCLRYSDIYFFDYLEVDYYITILSFISKVAPYVKTDNEVQLLQGLIETLVGIINEKLRNEEEHYDADAEFAKIEKARALVQEKVSPKKTG